MKMMLIELQKEKRTGIPYLFLAVGALGAVYALLIFEIRQNSLLSLPMQPMDILLTQVYGMIMILNMFGIVLACCMIYHMEFAGSAVKKMYLLPMNISTMYLCKFLILTIMFIVGTGIQNLMLAKVGLMYLPEGTFQINALLQFWGYSVLTSMPVLSGMLFLSSLFEKMWISIGIGVAGFLSAMALGVSKKLWFLIHPFVVMLHPAVVMSAKPDSMVIIVAIAETILFFSAGLWTAHKLHYE